MDYKKAKEIYQKTDDLWRKTEDIRHRDMRDKMFNTMCYKHKDANKLFNKISKASNLIKTEKDFEELSTIFYDLRFGFEELINKVLDDID